MNACMFRGLGSSSVSSNQEQLSLLQDFLTPGTWPRAEFSTTACDLGVLDKEADSAMLANSRSGAGAGAVGADNEWLSFSDRMSTSCIAGLATGNQVLWNIIELDAVKVIHDQIVTARSLTYAPRNHLLTPVTGMVSWTNRTVEHFSVFRDLPMLRRQRVSLLATKKAISRL